MIKAKHIYKHYGDLQVLDDVSIDIKPAEVVSVVGSSGAGKTTLLQIIGTLDKANVNAKTQIEINGVDVTTLKQKALAKFRNQHIGFIFQFHQLLPEFTALENVCIPAFIKKTSQSEATKKAKELLDFLSISHRMNHKPSELSGGEQQRVAVARALINNPDVILADEPSGNLDSQNAKQLHDLFFRLRDEFKQTFVIVTHNKELADMADRKLEMKDGKILG
jgi:lipoprotein-releasing system ATP-binding protein